MRDYIKRGYRAALMALTRGSDEDDARCDAIHDYNMGIAEKAYTSIMDGFYDYAYIRDGAQLRVFHKSLRGNFIQCSHFCKLNGEWEATSHADVQDIREIADELISGRHINYKRI